jgi:hypothetical protein
LSSAIWERRRIDLNGAGVRVVNVALILQGIRGSTAKRRTPGQALKLPESELNFF